MDSSSRHRSYSAAQLRDAALVRELRGVDLPLEDVRRLLEGCADAGAILVDHRRRLGARADAIAGQLVALDHLIEKGLTMQDLLTQTRRSRLRSG